MSSQVRFVLGAGSVWIHATASHLATPDEPGVIRTLCRTYIELAPAPPQRVIGGTHDYCGTCLVAFGAFGSLMSCNVTERYPQWLITMAYGSPSNAPTNSGDESSTASGASVVAFPSSRLPGQT